MKIASRYGPAVVVFFVVWLPTSIIHAFYFGNRFRLKGPGEDSLTPIIDAWTFTGPSWAAVAFFVAVTVFVAQQWLNDRRRTRKSAPTSTPPATPPTSRAEG